MPFHLQVRKQKILKNETPSNDATSENENDQLEREGNKYWCKCGQCKREIREIDSLCCSEVPAIIQDRFKGKKCITLAHKFELLYLNNFKIVLVGLHETRGDSLENDKDFQNRSLPFSSHEQPTCRIFSIWVKGIDKLSCPVYYVQLENFFQRQMDSIISLKKVKEID